MIPSILYHWTSKKRKYRILKDGLKVKPCFTSPTGHAIYASADKHKWRSAIRYNYDGDVVCFSFQTNGLKIIKSINDFLVLENIPADCLKIEDD